MSGGLTAPTRAAYLMLRPQLGVMQIVYRVKAGPVDGTFRIVGTEPYPKPFLFRL